MTAIHLSDVVLTDTDGHRLLDGVSLDVPSGASLAVVGPRGAGKTALLRTIVGLEVPEAGEVRFDDVDVVRQSPRRRNAALVFQDHQLHDHLDVHDNLAFAARLRSSEKDGLEDRVTEVADALALAGVLADRPDVLDDAQRQRVAIGRSLVRDAVVHLFDDPFSQQDRRVRSHVRAAVTQWQRDRGATSIFTTSDVEEALGLADVLAVMHRGRVHQIGSARDLYDRPADLIVAGLLGSPAMNLVPARVDPDRLLSPAGQLPIGSEDREGLGERPLVILGVRPDALRLGAGTGSEATFTGVVDDVEWRGGFQRAFVGFELTPTVEAYLQDIEDVLEQDLFSNFFVADLPTDVRVQPGDRVSMVAPLEAVHVFDPDTGQRL